MQNNIPAIQLKEIDFCWGAKTTNFRIQVKDFRLEKSESVILVGPSGGGKSTLLSLICGIVKPQNGNTKILGKDLEKMSNQEKDGFRADNIGIIFQQFNLLPYLSALDNVLLPLEFSKSRKTASGKTKEKLNEEAKRLLKSLGIEPETIDQQKAATLSIGQQQRVAAARAFIGSPNMIIADEPTSSLDEETQDKFLEQLFSEKKTTGASLLMVSHNPRIAKRFDRVVKLENICVISHEKEKVK